MCKKLTISSTEYVTFSFFKLYDLVEVKSSDAATSIAIKQSIPALYPAISIAEINKSRAF